MSRRRRRQRRPNEADGRWARRLLGQATPADLAADADDAAEAERRRAEDVGQVDGIRLSLAREKPGATAEDVAALGLTDGELLHVAAGVCGLKVVEVRPDNPLADSPGETGPTAGGSTSATSSATSSTSPTPTPSPSTSSTPPSGTSAS